ncbi:MAG: hypothetical protein ACKPGI_14970 [Verrucomicrobiota bacterium]
MLQQGGFNPGCARISVPDPCAQAVIRRLPETSHSGSVRQFATPAGLDADIDWDPTLWGKMNSIKHLIKGALFLAADKVVVDILTLTWCMAHSPNIFDMPLQSPAESGHLGKR